MGCMVALFAFGVALSLHHGRRGYMPLDQSIVFDGGWRILSGQIPFHDYHAPNGFTPHVLQALFFGLFGVNWFAYCLHAAVLNGAFAVVAARLLVRLGLNLPAALVYGGLSAVVLVPPFGVPYMDQHAFFFSFLAIALAVRARATERTSRIWFAVPPVLLLAGLSKQIPSVFAVPIVLGCVPWTDRVIARQALVRLSLGALAALGLLGALVLMTGMDLERIQTYFVRLPGEEGQLRTTFAPTAGAVLERMRFDGRRVGLWSVQVVHVGFALGALLGLAALVRARSLRDAEARAWFGRLVRRPLLAWALLLMCLGFTLLTSNQPELGFPLIFVCLGLVHATLAVTGARLPGLARHALTVVGLGLLAVGLRDAAFFERTVNTPRSVNDMQFEETRADDAADHLARGLEYMRWQLPPVLRYGPAQFRDLVEFLRGADGNVFLISDASIVYGLAGKPSIAPSLWFHPGLLIPRPEDPAFASFEDELMARIEEHDVRFIVLDDIHTWTGYSLESFPQLAALVERRRCGVAQFGPFEVIDLCDR